MENKKHQIVIIDDEKKQFLLKTETVIIGLKSPNDEKFQYASMSVERLSKIITEGLDAFFANASEKFEYGK